MTVEQLLYKVNSDIIVIGRKLLQNKKLDYQNDINYLRFYKLISYKQILNKFMIPNTVDLSRYSYDEQKIFDTIKNTVLSI